MEGWHPDGYPGNLAYSPELWEWMFALGLKLNFDPSHLMWLGIDPVSALRPYVDHVAHVQAKDIQCDAQRRNRYGFFGKAVGTRRSVGHRLVALPPAWSGRRRLRGCHRRALRGRVRRHRVGRARRPGVGWRSRPRPHRPRDRVQDVASADRRRRRRIIEGGREDDTSSRHRIGRRADRRQRPGRLGVRALDRGCTARRDDPHGRGRSEALRCRRRTHLEHDRSRAARVAARVAGTRRRRGAPAARHQPGLTRARGRRRPAVHLARVVHGRRARAGRRRGRAPGRQHVERSRWHGRLLDRIVSAPERLRAHPVHPGRRVRSVVRRAPSSS